MCFVFNSSASSGLYEIKAARSATRSEMMHRVLGHSSEQITKETICAKATVIELTGEWGVLQGEGLPPCHAEDNGHLRR